MDHQMMLYAHLSFDSVKLEAAIEAVLAKAKSKKIGGSSFLTCVSCTNVESFKNVGVLSNILIMASSGPICSLDAMFANMQQSVQTTNYLMRS